MINSMKYTAQYFLKEKNVQFISLILSIATVVIRGFNIETICIITYIISLTMISIHDVKTRKIPNEFIASLFFVALLFTMIDVEVILWERMAGAVIIGGVLLLVAIVAPKSIGGGDVKLMAVSGLILGLWNAAVATVIGIFLAGIFVILLLGINKIRRTDQIPLGPFLCIGCYIAMLYGNVIIECYLKL